MCYKALHYFFKLRSDVPYLHKIYDDERPET